MTTSLNIRVAAPADLPVLHRIAERAVWELLAGRYYTEAQMAAGRAAHAYHVEPELVTDGTYYVLEVDRVIAAGSGWSRHGTFHPRPADRPDAPALVAGRGIAVMRATYVDPDWARRGFATLLSRTTEAAAVLEGYRRFEALCTPGSEGVRRKLGYRLLGRVELPLVEDVTITMAHMRKDLPAQPATRPSSVRSAS